MGYCNDCGIQTTNLASIRACNDDCHKSVCRDGCPFPCEHCGKISIFGAARKGPQKTFICPATRCRRLSKITYSDNGTRDRDGWHIKTAGQLTVFKGPPSVDAGDAEALQLLTMAQLLTDDYYQLQPSKSRAKQFWAIIKRVPQDVQEKLCGMLAFSESIGDWRGHVTEESLAKSLRAWFAAPD